MKTLIVILLIIFASLAAEGAERQVTEHPGATLFYTAKPLDDTEIATVNYQVWQGIAADPVTTSWLMDLTYTCHDKRTNKDAKVPPINVVMDGDPACEVHQESFDKVHKLYKIHYNVAGSGTCGRQVDYGLDLRALCAEWLK